MSKYKIKWRDWAKLEPGEDGAYIVTIISTTKAIVDENGETEIPTLKVIPAWFDYQQRRWYTNEFWYGEDITDDVEAWCELPNPYYPAQKVTPMMYGFRRGE